MRPIEIEHIDLILLSQTHAMIFFVLYPCQFPARFAWTELHSGLPAESVCGEFFVNTVGHSAGGHMGPLPAIVC